MINLTIDIVLSKQVRPYFFFFSQLSVVCINGVIKHLKKIMKTLHSRSKKLTQMEAQSQ